MIEHPSWTIAISQHLLKNPIVQILDRNLYCDTKSRNCRLFSEGSNLCLNPASRRCDPMEACAQGASLTGMKPS
jgi:hypothetical protein